MTTSIPLLPAATTNEAVVRSFLAGPNAVVLHADARHALASLPDNSVDAVVTDPPYGLSKEPDITEVLSHWIAGDDYQHTGKGFMGTTWDSFVPGPVVWREVYRVLKPGGYAAVFASTRTYDLMVTALRLAGFQVIDTLMWMNSQGFPKSLNISHALDKAGHDELAERLSGYGNALKPAHEPIALVRKPLEGRYVDNVVAHGVGVLNIDACRVHATLGAEASKGRFPSNVLFDHAVECVEVERDGRVEYACVLGCQVRELDNQSGVRTSGKPGTYRGTPNRSAAYGAESRKAGEAMTGYGDSGGASRFFPTFKYAPKATQKERVTVYVPDNGCVTAGHCPDPHEAATPVEVAASFDPRVCEVCAVDWVAYQHPTVKPVGGTPTAVGKDGVSNGGGLMGWLSRLVCPEGGVILDPFAGTGTTGSAAVAEGFSVVLVERDPVHVAMTNLRVHGTVEALAAADASVDGQTSLF